MSSAPVRLDLSGGPLIVLTAMLLLTFAAVVAMAFNITGIMQSFALSNSAAGLIASTENLAIAISSLYVAQVAARLPARLIYVGGVLAVLVANGLTIFADSVGSLVFLRAIAGLGAGAVTAIVMYTAGHSASPEKTFGVINSFVGILGVLMALVLPQALLLHTRTDPGLGFSAADGLYLVYFLAACVALLLVRWVPLPPARTVAAPDPASSAAASASRPPVPLLGWIALSGIGIVFFGHGTLGIYIVELGLATGLTSQSVGNAFAIASLFGIAAPLVGGWIGASFRATLPIGCVLAALVLFALLLANNESALGFYVLAPLYSIAPMTMLPIALGVLARIDSSGRLTGSHPAFVMLGGAAAPIVGGALRDLSGGFALTGWCVVACVVIGAVCMFRAIAISDAGRAAVPSTA
jgi:predicted MFS family arabinose efflux permease